MQSRDQDDLIPFFQEVVAFTLQFPVCVIDKHEDSRSSRRMISRYNDGADEAIQ